MVKIKMKKYKIYIHDSPCASRLRAAELAVFAITSFVAIEGHTYGKGVLPEPAFIARSFSGTEYSKRERNSDIR